MAVTLQQLKELKEKLHGGMVQLKDGLAEGEVFTDDQIKQWDELSAQMATVDADIATKERLLSLDPPSDPSNPGRQFSPAIITRQPAADPAMALRGWALSQIDRPDFITPEMEAARGDMRWDEPLTAAVRWDQTAGTETEGGHSINEAMVTGMVKTMKAFGGMMRACRIFNTTTGVPIKKVTRNTTNFKATKIAELVETSNTDQTLGKVVFGETELASGIYPISLTLLRDSAYDIMSDFNQALGESFGRGANELLTKGSAADEPQGIQGAVTAITAEAPSLTMVNNLFHSVDEAYRMSASCYWMMNDNTVKRLKNTLLDADGRPLYKQQPNIVGGYPYVMESKPVVINTDLDDNVIIFGDFSRYEIRMVGGITITVLRELFAKQRAIGMIGHTGIDGRLVDSAALRKITLAA